MKQKTNNPQAFPDPMRGTESSVTNQSPNDLDTGMTLRDYFAAKAMQGIIAHFGFRESDEGLSKSSYKVADEMLKQR